MKTISISLGKSKFGGRGYAGQTISIIDIHSWRLYKARPILKAYVCCMYGWKAWAWHLLGMVSRAGQVKIMGMYTYSLFDKSKSE